MGIWHSIFGIILIILFVLIGIEALNLLSFFTIFIPYLAIIIFLSGFIYRIFKWASSPVPFHIPIVSGQQKSLLWIKPDGIDSPYTPWGVIKRLSLDIIFFRTLLKNERVEIEQPYKILFKPSVLLWLGGLAFHWSFLFVILRHLRFFLEPVPSLLVFLIRLDSILQGLLPVLYISDIIFLLSLAYLFLRRVISPQIKYISLSQDYFIILLILGIAISGILMRLFYKVDLIQVKEWTLRMLTLHSMPPKGVNLLFYIHLFFVSVLISYIPFSKVMHMAGIFLTPTKNLKNTSRNERHINPWNYPVKIHTYEEYEEEFRDSMKEVGLPLERS